RRRPPPRQERPRSAPPRLPGGRRAPHPPPLAPVAALAGKQRERLDGSGYPAGLAGDAIPPAARVLAAADSYQAMLEPRPHRPARSAREAAAELRGDARAGRLDPEAVAAVLAAAGHRVARRRAHAPRPPPPEPAVRP